MLHTQQHIDNQCSELAGYFEVPGAHLYTVRHQVSNPVARALLVGPFASERHNSYLPWVRWARYLAARRIEVLRYDYRGIGESTGRFEEMTFENWTEDVQVLVRWLKTQSPDAPLLLHGLEIGAILAGKVFEMGSGDALLMWSPPAIAHEALRSTLLRWVGLEQFYKDEVDRKSASDYIRQLEQGFPVEIEGYEWSSRLWHDSFDFRLPAAVRNEASIDSPCERPVRSVKLGKEAAPLVKGGFVGYDEAKDFSWLFTPNFDWITTALAVPKGAGNAGDN